VNYWLGVIGTWMVADGVASLWQYTREDCKGQSWLRDHSLRIFRALLGLVLIVMGVI
jgi:hypothetical protein